MANIMILNGAARKNGRTASLVKAFMDGAERAGNTVREFYLQDMNIKGCMGCNGCVRASKDEESPCVQKDDMIDINKVFRVADVVVFASPVYFWTITGPLKTVATDCIHSLRALAMAGFQGKAFF